MHHVSQNKKIPTLHATRYTLRGNAGFTLIETFVAITVLLMAIAAPLTLASQGLSASRIARDQVTATYLIQEAVEYIRNARDTNTLSGNSWLEGFDDCLEKECTIDVPAGVIASCGKTCDVLDFHASSGLYGYHEDSSGWEASRFTRTITIQESLPGVEAHLVVTVGWQDGLRARTLTTNEIILNWQ